MKSSISFILTFLLCLSINTIIQVNAECWDYPNPLKPWEKTKSKECGTQKEKNLDGLSSQLDQPSVIAPQDAFQINFTCITSNQSLCSPAENSFKAAGNIIGQLIKFNKPIVVNATFADFCKVLGECSGNILGAASAARTIPLADDDNIIRQYPQALAKQFLLSPEPQWGPFDIRALFNAEASLFFGGGQIRTDQFDFQYIILHELIHGLGFASGWNNYFSDTPVALTPNPGFLDQLKSLNDPVNYTGFEQTAFDKYMVNAKDTTKSPISMSDLAVQMDGFAPIGKQFSNAQNLLDTFSSSQQFILSQSLINDSQTPQTFAFRPQNASNTNDLVFLETNLKPFQQGSSVSHMNVKFFKNSTDFLEVFNAVRGKSLDQILTASGGKFPIGPKLQSVLETLGYTTDNNPTPYKPRLPDSPTLAQPNTPTPLPVGDNPGNGNSTISSTSSTTGSSYGSGYGSSGPSGSDGSSGSMDPSNNNTIMNNSINEPNSAKSLTSSFNVLSLIIVVALTLIF